ncbi:MAG: hypothetical protein H6713_08355 [Myxococcales bacterium]|nr:hypothetical protein [Myxococcales bacterium]
MSTPAFSQPCRLRRELLHQYELFRRRSLTPGGRRRLIEIIDLLELYLEERGVHVIDTRAEASPGIIHGVASLATVLALIDDFADDYLADTVRAEPTLIRLGYAVARDVARWLRGKQQRGRRLRRASGS